MRAKTLSFIVLGTTLLSAVAFTGMRTSSPAAAATGERPVIGYTLRTTANFQSCELVTVDWATGAVTDLPAVPSPDACVNDLAVGPDGVVHGFIHDMFLPESAEPSILPVEVGHLVTFAADGTPTRTVVSLPTAYLIDDTPSSVVWGIAVDASGTINIVANGLWANVVTCEPGILNGNALGSASFGPVDGIDDWMPCLFTLDPTTGALTLVGSTRLLAGDFGGLSIGSDGAWSVAIENMHLPIASTSTDPAPTDAPLPPNGYWSRMNRTTGEATLTAATYPTNYGNFDQLRTRPIVFNFVRDVTTGTLRTGTVDPTTGEITPIAVVQETGNLINSTLAVIEGPEPEPDIPKFTG